MRLATARLTLRPALGRDPLLTVMTAALLLVAVGGWWWSVRMADDMAGGMAGDMAGGMAAGDGMGEMGRMTMSLGAFVVAWAAMMAAMMLPSVLPVVRLYARAAAKGGVAPVPFFVAGYLVVWTLVALPGYLAWRELHGPVTEGEAWAGRVAGATLIAAAVYQLSPLKAACLSHCRSPLGFFLRFGQQLRRPSGAVHMGMRHAVYCFGCCWALFAVLVALGTMNLLWMAILTILIVLEKTAPGGSRIALVGALGLAAVGALLLVDPSMLTRLA